MSTSVVGNPYAASSSRKAGLTMLLVEQSIARARDFADGLSLIRAGRSIIAAASPISFA